MELSNDIILSINTIDDIVIESHISILESYLSAIGKSISILQNYDGDNVESFDIFVEDGTFRKTDKDGKMESIIKSIIAFVPRLVILIGEIIAKTIKNITSGQVKDDMEKIFDNDLSDEKVSEIEAALEKEVGKVKIDVKEKAIAFMNIDWKTHLDFLLSTYSLLKRIKHKFSNIQPHETRAFIKELDEIIRKGKQGSIKTVTYGIRALNSLTDDMCEVTNEIHIMSKELSKLIVTKMKLEVKKENPDEKTLTSCMNIKELLERIMKVVREIEKPLTKLHKVTKILKFFSVRTDDSKAGIESICKNAIEEVIFVHINPLHSVRGILCGRESDAEYTDKLIEEFYDKYYDNLKEKIIEDKEERKKMTKEERKAQRKKHNNIFIQAKNMPLFIAALYSKTHPIGNKTPTDYYNEYIDYIYQKSKEEITTINDDANGNMDNFSKEFTNYLLHFGLQNVALSLADEYNKK